MDVTGSMVGIGGQMSNAPMSSGPVDEQDRDFLFGHTFTQGAAELEATIKDVPPGKPLHSPWPAEFVALYAGDFYQGMNCVSASKTIGASTIAGVLDAVRNKVLNFALEIEAIQPDAGESGPPDTPISEEQVSQIFNTAIYGGQNVVASGNRDVTQQVDQALTVDWDSLSSELTQLGLQPDDLDSLKVALAQDGASQVAGALGPATQGWVGGIATRVATKSLELVGGAGAEAVVALLVRTLGG